MTTRTLTRPTHESIDPTSEEGTRHTAATPVDGVAAAPVRHRIELSATQLIASAFAAVTTTVAASFLGVAGTVAGAALASVLTVTGNAVYGFSLRRTHDRVRAVVPPAARRRVNDPSATTPNVQAVASRAVHGNANPVRPRPRPMPTGARCDHAPLLPSSRPRSRADRDAAARRSPWRAIALASIVLFTGVLAVVTTVEVVAGRPLTDVLRGDSGSGTTLFGGGTGGVGTPTTPQPVPTVTQTVTPSVQLVTPTITQTAPARTVTTTPTTTPTATVTSTPSPTTSDSGATSGSGAPTSSPSTSDRPAPLP